MPSVFVLSEFLAQGGLPSCLSSVVDFKNIFSINSRDLGSQRQAVTCASSTILNQLTTEDIRSQVPQTSESKPKEGALVMFLASIIEMSE